MVNHAENSLKSRGPMFCFLLTSTKDLVLIFSSASSTCLTSPPSLMKSWQGQRNTVGDIKIKHFCDFNSQTTSKIWSTCLSSVMLSLIWQGRMKKKETDSAVSNPFILPYNIFSSRKVKQIYFPLKLRVVYLFYPVHRIEKTQTLQHQIHCFFLPICQIHPCLLPFLFERIKQEAMELLKAFFSSTFNVQLVGFFSSHQHIPFPVCNDSCAYALGCGDDHFRQMFSRLQNFANTHNITSHKNKNVFLGKHEKRFIWPLRHLWNDPLSQKSVTLIIWNGLPTISQSSELQDIWLISVKYKV